MYFTEEQILFANEMDLEKFLLRQGEDIKKSGKEVRWARHDSVTINGNKWYRHSRSKGGYPVAFLKEFYGLEFKEAVAFLLKEQGIDIKSKNNISIKTMQKPKKIKEKKPFKLPKKMTSTENIYKYLVEERCLDKEIVDYFVDKNMIYENYYGSLVFTAYDSNNIPKYAQIKVLNQTENFPRDSIVIEGSDYRVGFRYLGNSDNLYVFESHIDLLSYITLNKEKWQDNSYISLSGVNSNMLIGLLEERKFGNIYLCLDNDEAGIEAIYKILDEIKEDIKGKRKVKNDFFDENKVLVL